MGENKVDFCTENETVKKEAGEFVENILENRNRNSWRTWVRQVKTDRKLLFSKPEGNFARYLLRIAFFVGFDCHKFIEEIVSKRQAKKSTLFQF